MFLQANLWALGRQEYRSDPGCALTNGISWSLITCLYFQLSDWARERGILCTQELREDGKGRMQLQSSRWKHTLVWPISPSSSQKPNHFRKKKKNNPIYNTSSNFRGSYFTGRFWDWGTKWVQFSAWFCSRLLVSHEGSHLTSWYLRSHLCCERSTTCPRGTVRRQENLRRVSDTAASWPGEIHTLKTGLHSSLFVIHRWFLHHL